MLALLISVLVWCQVFVPIEGCHWTTLIIQNGTEIKNTPKPVMKKQLLSLRSSEYNKKSPCTCSEFDMSQRQRPWAAMVIPKGSPAEGSLSSCSATLISRTTFITTASCICGLLKEPCPFKEGHQGAFTNKSGNQLSVRLSGDSITDIQVHKILVHAKYKASNPPLNDIGLLQISTELGIPPICFPTPSLLKAKKVESINCHIVSNELKCNEKSLYHYTGIRNGKDETLCTSNGLGPSSFKKCVFNDEIKTCMDSNPLSSYKNSPNCTKYMDEFNNKTMTESKLAIIYENEICINPQYRLSDKYGPYFSKAGKGNGWCYTCGEGDLKDCKEWGFCSSNCPSSTTSSEVPLSIIEGIANSIRDQEKCGVLKKSICLMDAIYTGDNLVLKRNSDNKLESQADTHFGLIKSLRDLREKIESSPGGQCKDLTGGAIWKLVTIGRKKKTKAPFLTGLMGKFENICGDPKGKFLDVKHVDIHSYASEIIDVVQDLCTMSLKKKKKMAL